MKEEPIKVADDYEGPLSVEESQDYDRGSSDEGYPLRNTIMDLDVEVKCINLTQLRGFDKFDKMVAGTFGLNCNKNDLVSTVKGQIDRRIHLNYPKLSNKFELEELRINETLSLPLSVRLYSLVQAGKYNFIYEINVS